MLPVGALRQCYDQHPRGQWTNFTQAEQRTMLTLWCMMRAPLMIGAELTKNDDFTLALLTNREVLAIERESWCAHPLFTTENACAWIAPRRDGAGCYVAAFNLADRASRVQVDEACLEAAPLRATELWTGRVARKGLIARLAPHDAAVWRVEFQ
jgi:hypothetical protein